MSILAFTFDMVSVSFLKLWCQNKTTIKNGQTTNLQHQSVLTETVNLHVCSSASVHAYNSVTEDKLHLAKWILFTRFFSNTEGKNLKSMDPAAGPGADS